MKRREFISRSRRRGHARGRVAARAQQAERMRRIGVLTELDGRRSGISVRASCSVPARRCTQLGWAVDRNVRIDYRWARPMPAGFAHSRRSWLALAPDVILANAPPERACACNRRAVPCRSCSPAVTDPVGMGIVQSLARPGGNSTGFTSAEFGMSAKWLELLKEIAPSVKRVAVLQEPSNPGAMPQFAAIQTVAPSFGVELTSLGARDAGAIERGVNAFARCRKQWPDRDQDFGNDCASRPDRHAGVPASFAGSLLRCGSSSPPAA